MDTKDPGAATGAPVEPDKQDAGAGTGGAPSPVESDMEDAGAGTGGASSLVESGKKDAGAGMGGASSLVETGPSMLAPTGTVGRTAFLELPPDESLNAALEMSVFGASTNTLGIAQQHGAESLLTDDKEMDREARGSAAGVPVTRSNTKSGTDPRTEKRHKKVKSSVPKV
jgi:hypothetical protein